MKNIFTLSLIVLFAYVLDAQETVSIEHDGYDRSYIIYVPANYTGAEAVPLLFNFHGFGSNALEQMWYGDFRAIADEAGFILVHPQGLPLNGTPHWNVGGFTLGSTIDDVGFTSAMIDELVATYNINEERIYSTGMSNGGYMSFLLACQLSDRIAAIASVTGSMTPETYNACNPSHPTPVLQIHGLNDSVVPYFGAIWSRSIDDVMEYWVNENECMAEEIATDIPNTNSSDGSTATHIIYGDCANEVTAEHVQIDGGDHTWPGTALVTPGTNLDFKASEMIWEFFSRYDINGVINSTSTETIIAQAEITVYPNPASNYLNLSGLDKPLSQYEIIDLMGNKVLSGEVHKGNPTISIKGLGSNVYFLKTGSNYTRFLKLN